MHSWHDRLAPALQELQAQDAYRRRRLLGSAQGPKVLVDDRHLINFSSNDYLGLASHPKVVEAFSAAAHMHGVGSGASHLVVGHHQLHHQLEDALARHTGRDRALLFSCGYMANLAVLQALTKKNDIVYSDKLNHASLVDGVLASDAKLIRYKHNSIDHLNSLIKKPLQHSGMIVTDSVFSMDGDVAPINELADIAVRHQLALMVDDAHAFGVLGATGAGSAEYFGLNQQQLPIIMGTLGKAVGVMGAFVAGSEELIETLIQRARNYIYTTALPPACSAAAMTALQVCQSEPQRREHLAQLVRRFQAGCEDFGLNLHPKQNAELVTPIQPVLAGSNEKALALSDYLLQRGILAAAIRPPTVPEGTARLRISFSAAHTEEQVDDLLNVLESGSQKVGLAA